MRHSWSRRTPMKLISEGPPSYRGSASSCCNTIRSACRHHCPRRLRSATAGYREQLIDQVGLAIVAAQQVLGDAPDPGTVVERHHDHTEEYHGGYRADPVVVHDAYAVLGAACRHPENLDRAEIGGDEGNAGNPGGQ